MIQKILRKARKGTKVYLVTGNHDEFLRPFTPLTKRWFAVLGDVGYDFVLFINHYLQKLRKLMGIKKYWSLSKYVKDNIKSSVSFITDFEGILSTHAQKKRL